MSTIFWLFTITAVLIYFFFKRLKTTKNVGNAGKFTTSSTSNTKAPDLSKTIGETAAVCPYCGTELEKKPSRKKKCPHCENNIYKRTRPYDSAHIIIREDQIEDVDEQIAIANGEYELFEREKQRRIRISNRLTSKAGKKPSKDDVEFRALNERTSEFELKGDWGFARNMRLEMAKNLKKRKSYSLSFRMFCHLCFLDINGPNNRSGTKELLNKYPYFTPEHGMLSPGVIRIMNDLIKKLNYDEDDIVSEFIEVTSPIYDCTPTPISPNKALKELQKELKVE